MSRTNMPDFILHGERKKKKQIVSVIVFGANCLCVLFDVLKMGFLGQLALDGELRQTV